jgi:hypothetical protein
MKESKPELTEKMFKKLSKEKQAALCTVLAAMRDDDRRHGLTCNTCTDFAGNMVGRKLDHADPEKRLYWELINDGWIAKNRPPGHSSLPTATYTIPDTYVPWIEKQLAAVA